MSATITTNFSTTTGHCLGSNGECKPDVKLEYFNDYNFALIRESQGSRKMITRYINDMLYYAEYDVATIGCKCANLSCV